MIPGRHDKRWDLVADEPEPRWYAVAAVLSVGLIRFILPSGLHVGPNWLVLSVVLACLLAITVLRRQRKEYEAGLVSIAMIGFVTLFLVASVGLMVYSTLNKLIPPRDLLLAAAGLWMSNVIVFAAWYWRLDGGGPHIRDLNRAKGGHREGAFLFPQMTLDDQQRAAVGCENWSPHFVDYLFLAFNTSTALSPADTSSLTPWAKVMGMLQSMLSLTIIVLLASRAVNIL